MLCQESGLLGYVNIWSNNFFMSINKPSYKLSPLGIWVNLIFVSLASLLFLLLSFFPESDFVQWIRTHTTPDARMVLGIIPLKVWFIIALFIGIYIPLLILIIYRFNKWLSRLLLPYLAICAVQIVTEFILTKILFPGFALIAGIIYTAYRLWQLQTAIRIHEHRLIQKERVDAFLQNFLLLAASFWMLNLLFLLSAIFV